MEYKRCEECKQIIQVEEGRRIKECPYCGSKESFIRASEKEWRQYYRGVVLQPFMYIHNNINQNTQTTFVLYKKEEKEKWKKK